MPQVLITFSISQNVFFKSTFLIQLWRVWLEIFYLDRRSYLSRYDDERYYVFITNFLAWGIKAWKSTNSSFQGLSIDFFDQIILDWLSHALLSARLTLISRRNRKLRWKVQVGYYLTVTLEIENQIEKWILSSYKHI